jgi:hypothetical protein
MRAVDASTIYAQQAKAVGVWVSRGGLSQLLMHE